MGATLSTLDKVTKQVYGPRIVDQLDDEITITKRMEKTSRNTTATANGKYVRFPLKTRRNQGIGYRNELEQLQAPGQQGWNEVQVGLKYGYGRVHLSGQAIELVNENSEAFVSSMNAEMNGLKDDIKKDTNRILWGNGLGVLGTVATAGTTVNTVDVGTGFDDVKWFDMDMQVDVLSSDGATVRASNRKVTAINEATGVITVDGGTFSTVVGDIVVRTGNYGREPNGLTSLIKSGGALFGLDAANEPMWNSTVDSSGGALSEVKMITMCDSIRQKSGTRPSVIFTDLGTRRAYFSLLKGDRRFTNTQKFDGGFTGLAFSYDEDIPVVTDIDAPAGKMWFVREEDFTIYHRKEWDWEDRDGSIWKWVNNYDAFEAMMKKYWEFALERRNSQGLMTGITPG